MLMKYKKKHAGWVLLEVVVQQGALVGDGAGQALAEAGVLLQGSLLAHLVILS